MIEDLVDFDPFNCPFRMPELSNDAKSHLLVDIEMMTFVCTYMIREFFKHRMVTKQYIIESILTE